MSADPAPQPLSNVRICIDFGTAMSKAALCFEDGERLQAQVLPIGAASGASSPFLTPSALFIDAQAVFAGDAAHARAARLDDPQREELVSFKTILAVANLEDSLSARLRPSLDPSQTFTYRDALVLYIAFLIELIDTTLGAMPDAPAGALSAPRRYTHPVWRPREGDLAYHRRLFDEAQAVSAILGSTLRTAQGAPIADARAALDAARANPGDGRIAGEIYEAHAAAAAHIAQWNGALRFALVFDMGAGTTDIAGFEISGALGAPVLSEIGAARRTIPLACDEIDAILLDILLRKWGASKSRSSQQRLWRSMSRSARSLKEDLFNNARIALAHEGKTITVRLNDMKGDKRFQSFKGALAAVYLQSLECVVQGAAEARADRVAVILAGGGAQLPLLQEIVRDARPKGLKGVEVSAAPLAPQWVKETPALAPIVDIFPQIAIALGGALANLD